MAGTPLFQVTDTGLAAASVATPTGPYIHVTGFQVGSGFGYDPQASDTGINGTLLYQGVPTSYQNIGNGTINIICEIPPDAGPFNFGEVAIFLDGSVMFAKAVFDEPQTKFSSLGTNVVSSYTLNCLLKLQQSIAVFQIDTINGPPAVWEVDKWSDVYPPGISANPDIPLTLVRELSEMGESSLLENTNDSYWTLGSTSYMRYGGTQNRVTFPVANASTTWIEFAAAYLRAADLTSTQRRYVIKTADGFYRSVASVVVSGSNYRFNLNPDPLLNTPTVNSAVTIYRDDQRGGTIYYGQIVDPPYIPPAYTLPPATTSTRGGVVVGDNIAVDGNGRISVAAPPVLAGPGVPGLAYAGSGLYMPSAGVMEANGLLHSPSQNTGRILGGGDNLNDTGLRSGIYATQSGTYGLPANMPVSWDGIIDVRNFGSLTQVYYPGSTGGGDAAGNGGFTMYYRAWTGSQWTSWFPFYINGKNNPSGGHSVVGPQGISNPFSMTMPKDAIVHIWTNDGNPNNNTSMKRNGVEVSRNKKGGGAGYGRNHHDTGFFLAGDRLDWSFSTNDQTPMMNIMYI